MMEDAVIEQLAKAPEVDAIPGVRLVKEQPEDEGPFVLCSESNGRVRLIVGAESEDAVRTIAAAVRRSMPANSLVSQSEILPDGERFREQLEFVI